MTETRRFDRLKTEVVSGGTQSPEPAPQATPQAMVIGGVAWLALFVVLWFYSPWMVVFVIGLAASIMLHEFGHFWTARRSGMKVTQFFLGFGPRVWSVHRNGVEYGVRAIPLGGFVKIIGMTNLDEVDPADESMTYREASYPRRMWVITAGSVMHMILAIVTITIVYAVWGPYRQSGHVSLLRVEADSPAAVAGLRAGDTLLVVGGTVVTTSTELTDALAVYSPGQSVTLEVERRGVDLTLEAVLGQNPTVTSKRAYLGVGHQSEARSPVGLGAAITDGSTDLVRGVGQAVVGIVKVINPVNVWGHLVGTNNDPTSRPGTIVGATRISDDVGRADGWAGALSLLAMVNLSVGVFNMFPLLPLDGGHAAIATYERLRSRRGRRYYADAAKLMPVAAVCLALLAFMFLTGLYLDTAKL